MHKSFQEHEGGSASFAIIIPNPSPQSPYLCENVERCLKHHKAPKALETRRPHP